VRCEPQEGGQEAFVEAMEAFNPNSLNEAFKVGRAQMMKSFKGEKEAQPHQLAECVLKNFETCSMVSQRTML